MSDSTGRTGPHAAPDPLRHVRAQVSALGRVLVTGASGFVGRRLCAALVDAGAPTRALVRTADRAPAGTEPAVGDLDDPSSLRRACGGVDTVVHLAARVHVLRDASADPAAAYRRANVDGTRALLAGAAEAGAGRFVFVSSVKAVGEASGAAPWDESQPPRPVDPYGVSKLEAELAVREAADRNGIHAPVLRLPLVYGPGVRANMLRLFDLVTRGVPLPLGAVENRRSLAFVDNVVAAVVAALAAPAAARETMFVSDGEDVSTPELVRRIAAALGARARLVPVPVGLFRAAGAMGDVLARVAPWPLTTAAVDRLVGSLAVDISRLRRVTGYRPPVTLDEGLATTARWYREAQARPPESRA